MGAKKTVVEVHKFGGASLSDGAAFRHAVIIVQGRRAAPVVVVSAPAGITDVLLGLATRAVAGDRSGRAALESDVEALRERYHQIAAVAVGGKAGEGRKGKGPKSDGGIAAEIDRSIDELAALLSSLAALKELTPRTRDFIVSRGERLSAQIFAGALAAAGTPSAYVDATDIVFTDGPFGGASPNLTLTDLAVRKKLQPLVAVGKVPVVPGFIGGARIEDEHGTALEERAVATLGRGGSDLTASLLGRALAATEVSLWKDVSGLLTADPRVVPDARVIPQLHLREAAELAYYGAKVLHPRALIPIAGRPVPVFVRPFADPGAAGTEISARRTLDKYPVKALSAAGGQALITVGGNGMLGVPGIAARTFESLHREGISVSLISQSSSEQSICFSVPGAAGKRARTRLLEEFHDEIVRKDIDGIEVQDGLATVAVVGLGMAGHLGIASRVFGALAEAGINIVAIAQGSSELNISFVVAAKDAAPAQRAVHAAFQLAKIGGGAATRAEHRDVVLLGFGQIGRALAGIMAKEAKKKRNGSSKLRLTAAIDTTGFVFEPGGLTARVVGELAESKQAGHGLAETRAGRRANPADALTVISQHALANPILVDLTAADTTPLVIRAVDAGMDV